jgi:hypothetical protein
MLRSRSLQIVWVLRSEFFVFLVAVAPVRLPHLQALEIVLVKIFERRRHNPLGKVDAMSRKASCSKH